MTKKQLLLGLLILLGLAGCIRSGGPSPIGTPSPAPFVSPQAAPAGISLTYQRSGGFAGTNDTWRMDATGAVTHHGVGTDAVAQLTSDQLAELTAAIRAADFITLQESYVPANTCCDRFEHVITLTINGRSKTVRTLDAAPTAPPELTQLIDTLTRLFTTAAAPLE